MRAAATAILLLALLPAAAPAAGDSAEPRIGRVRLLDAAGVEDPALKPYQPLVDVRPGDPYRYPPLRRSIENLHRTGMFAGVEVRMQEGAGGRRDLFFVLQRKPRVRALVFAGDPPLPAKAMRAAIYSLRRGNLFEEGRLPKAVAELQELLRSRGYFGARVTPSVRLSADRASCAVQFAVAPGRVARIARLVVDVDDPQQAGAILGYYRGRQSYLPQEFARAEERTRRLLKAAGYYFPEIKLREEFLDLERTALNLTVSVACGFRYRFVFQGMDERMDLVADVWERQVFEKWAEEESRARLLNHLKNEGYFAARVTSSVATRGGEKTILFAAEKNRRYRLGRITVSGNRAVAAEKIHEIIRADNLLFNKLFWLRLSSLVADLEVLKLYYYFQGISPLEIRLEPSFRSRRVDIEFAVSEGSATRMGSVEFNGNRAFAADRLYRLLKSRTGAPYVPKQLSDDIVRLQNFYWDNGYDDAAIRTELSPGAEKSLLITIHEGELRRTGQLILIGASPAQRGLLRRLYPLRPGEPFSRNLLEAFRADVENSAVFAEVRVEKLLRADGVVDVLVRVVADRSRLTGFGIGWEERRGPRGTLELQERNLLRSTSSLAATLQLGVNTRDGRLVVNDRRGLLTVDTPLYFAGRLNSSLQLWEEDETYPSYRFRRWGLGASLVKKFSDTLFLLASAKWYRTTLKWLVIPEYGVDQLEKPFNTTALSFSFVNEGRNDPFNPRSGHFLTADLKLGLPVFEKDYTFLKFFWNYQRHYPLLRQGTFSVSLKNGIAFGDMSISERFFAGGSHSFRGTRNDRLGPINLGSASEGGLKGKPEGGNILLLLNLEATLPSLLLPMKDLYFTLFADVGNVFAKSSDLNLRKMERALGFGLKYRTPMGPIRLDFAFNLRKAAEKNFLVQIGIGNVY